MRLIDADALLDKAWDADTRIGYVQVVDVGDILEAPTIDLVRCRDCKHRYDDGYCEVWGDSFYYWEEFDEVPEDMFCGHGERREDETDLDACVSGGCDTIND